MASAHMPTTQNSTNTNMTSLTSTSSNNHPNANGHFIDSPNNNNNNNLTHQNSIIPPNILSNNYVPAGTLTKSSSGQHFQNNQKNQNSLSLGISSIGHYTENNNNNNQNQKSSDASAWRPRLRPNNEPAMSIQEVAQNLAVGSPARSNK